MSARSSSGARRLIGLARANPEALLLIGAGLGLLLAARSSARDETEAEPNTSGERGAEQQNWASSPGPSAARPPREPIPDAGSLIRFALNPFEDWSSPGQLMKTPWALAALGLGAGAALGGALPGNAAENALLGEAREAAARRGLRALNDQFAKLRAAREAAAAKLKEEAEARALNPQGLKDLAHKVAEAAKEGAAGHASSDSGSASSPQSGASE